MGAIGGSFNSLKPIANCGVIVGVVASEFVVSFSEFITTSFRYGGELSYSTVLPVLLLVDAKKSSFLL
jgi:hypothetical protein